MSDDIDPTEPIVGPHGTVEHVPMPERDDPGLTDAARAALQSTRGTWLITSPGWTPAWSQYVLSIVELSDYPGLPPAYRKFDGATHELLVFALNPEAGLQTVATVQDHCRIGDLPYLQPLNVAEQFECTDDEIETVAWLAARAVVQGHLPPEPPLGYASFREMWLTACTKTLAHLRGEAHAS